VAGVGKRGEGGDSRLGVGQRRWPELGCGRLPYRFCHHVPADRNGVACVAGEVARGPGPSEPDDQQHPCWSHQLGELRQAVDLVDVVKHGHAGHDVKRALGEVDLAELADVVLDVIAVGTRLLDACPVRVDADDRLDAGPQPSGCLTFPATDVESTLCSLWHRTQQDLKGMEVRVPPGASHTASVAQRVPELKNRGGALHSAHGGPNCARCPACSIAGGCTHGPYETVLLVEDEVQHSQHSSDITDTIDAGLTDRAFRRDRATAVVLEEQILGDQFLLTRKTIVALFT
jgi:hypothetical protein